MQEALVIATGFRHMTEAIWNGVVVARSDRTIKLEGNHYFPPDSVRWEHLEESRTRSLCPWKGRASYFTLDAGGSVNPDAAWTYERPWPLARRIKGHVAFWRGVEIREEADASRRARRPSTRRTARDTSPRS